MEITINGNTHRINEGENVSSVIERLGLNPHLVAVELNRRIVRRSAFGEQLVEAGDRIEIVEFVGGG